MTDITYHPILVSDHSPLSLTLKIADLSTRGCKNVWRFDAALLKDEVFYKRVEEHISFFLKSNDRGDVDDSVLWESIKAVMRGHIISYKSWKSKNQVAALKDMESELRRLEQSYQATPTTDTLGKITKLKCEYNTMLSKHVCSQMVNSRQKLFELGDKSHRLLARELTLRHHKLYSK